MYVIIVIIVFITYTLSVLHDQVLEHPEYVWMDGCTQQYHGIYLHFHVCIASASLYEVVRGYIITADKSMSWN